MAYHVYTIVTRVVDSLHTITLSVGVSPTSTSLERVSGPLALNSEKPVVGGESSVEEGCTLVCEWVGSNQIETKKTVAHCYPIGIRYLP